MTNRSRRRRSAWGSITELDAGERYRIRYWAETPSGYRRKSETVRGTRKDAERRRAELMLEHSEDAPCPTVGQVWEKWALPMYERRVDEGEMSPRTLAGYQRSWTHDIAPTWSRMPCDQVRPLAVQQWITSLNLSQARRGVLVMGAILDYAVRYEHMEHNPMRERYVMPSRSTVKSRDAGVWSLDELGDVWRAVRDGASWMEAAFILAAFGGVRVSESVGPLAGEVETDSVGGINVALVPIVRQVTKETGVSDRLKTERSRRTVVIAGRAAMRLGEIASTMPPDMPLTNDGMGGWVTRDALNRGWRNDVMPRLPKDERHLFQNLRNGWQTNMRWTVGLAPYYIEVLMGHVGAGVTGRYYDRPTTDQLVSVVVKSWSTYVSNGGIDPFWD